MITSVSTEMRSSCGRRRTSRGRTFAVALPLVVALATAGCSGDDDTEDISVFSVKAGQCFTAPASVKVQLSKLQRTPCSKPHTLEAYAVTQYIPAGAKAPSRPRTSLPAVPSGIPSALPTAKPSIGKPSASVTVDTNYPGEDVLSKFADGTCAQRFGEYVGVDYLDSKLFFTYLLPSARSWEQAADRNVLCFVTTTGGKLTKSVKGTKR